MSSQPAIPVSRALLSSPSAGQARSGTYSTGVTATGVLLFVTALMVVASGYTRLRPMVMGLALHPSLVPVGLAFPFLVMSRLQFFPIRVLVAMLIFSGMYCFSVINGASIPVGEVFKNITTVITVVAVALMVRSRGDFVAGALGLIMAIALLAAKGLQAETSTGVEAIGGANRNSYSLFALPAILVAGFVCLRMQGVRTPVKAVFAFSSVVALMAIFMSGNRSGYLGAMIVGGMLFWDRRGRGMILVAAIAGAVMLAMLQFGSTKMFDDRMKQTMAGNKSDEYRLSIILACIQIGFENPVIGVSMQNLPVEIGRRTSLTHGHGQVEAHNLFAHVFAASGAICFGALIAMGWTMCAWRPRGGGTVGRPPDPLFVARKLMRMLVFLWIVRGMFTREIIFNPAFNIALGLAIGLCMLAEVTRKNGKVIGPDALFVESPSAALPAGTA